MILPVASILFAALAIKSKRSESFNNMDKIKKDATEQFLDLDRALKPVYFKVKQD